MNDIIGTPVERVIPEGWHVVRSAQAQEGDLLEHHGLWKELDHNSVPMSTDADGMLWGCALVIRRNAPEPSVEELQKRIESRDDLLEDRDAEIVKLKAKVAELEAENVRLGGLTGVVHDQEETVRWHRLRHLESTRQIDSLKAKVAELEKAAAAKDAEIEALRADRNHFIKWHAAAAARLSAVNKAMEGA